MVRHPQFFDERQISDQRQYELGLPPMDHQEEEGSPNQERYERAIAYLIQSRKLPGTAQVQAGNVATQPQQISSQPMQVAQVLQQANEDAEEYELRRYFKDDPQGIANPRRMPRMAASDLPSATAEVVAPPPRTVYMDAGTMEMIPTSQGAPQL